MKSIYLGGPFQFRYDGYTDEDLMDDYRSKIVGFDKFARGGDGSHPVRISEGVEYVGPFYFYDDEPTSDMIVRIEHGMVERCTDAFFLLDLNNNPGTLTEIVHATLTGKNVTIYYVRDVSDLAVMDMVYQSPQWYPITFAGIVCKNFDVRGFDTYDEAKSELIKKVKEICLKF